MLPSHRNTLIRLAPTSTKQLLPEELSEDVHRGALDFLQTAGIMAEGTKACDIIEKPDCAVDRESGIIKEPPGLVVEPVRGCPKSFHVKAWKPENDIILGGNRVYFSLFTGMKAVDIDSWEVRTPATQDNHDACKIADGLENITGRHHHGKPHLCVGQ